MGLEADPGGGSAVCPGFGAGTPGRRTQGSGPARVMQWSQRWGVDRGLGSGPLGFSYASSSTAFDSGVLADCVAEPPDLWMAKVCLECGGSKVVRKVWW